VVGGRYEVRQLLGRGRFGVVRLGVDTGPGASAGEHVALKFMTKDNDARVIETELRVLRKLMALDKSLPALQLGRVVTVPRSIVEEPDRWVVVLEYLWGGDLFDRIMIKGFVSEADMRPVVRDIARSLQALHEHGVLHRDIKPENVLFRVKGRASSESQTLPAKGRTPQSEPWTALEPVICDFGLSFLVGSEDLIEPPAGTFGYASPQMLSLERRFSRACDVWSLGVTLFSSLSGELPFPASTDGSTTIEGHLAEAYRGPRFTGPRFRDVSHEAKDLIERMLHYSPYNRITLEDVLSHAWLNVEDDYTQVD
jgi:serine/threonine protein kinase